MENFLDQPIRKNPVIEEYKKHVDMTLVRENLKLTYEQRLIKLMELQCAYDELRAAGKRHRGEST